MNDIKALIESKYSIFTDVDYIIANTILSRPHLVVENDITKLSKKLHVSKSSISRFCVKIGYPGFKELKFSLSNSSKDVESNGDNFNSMIEFIQLDYIKILNRMNGSIREKKIKKAVNFICQARCIFVVGIGSSGFLAQEFSYRLQRIGLISQAITDNDFIRMHVEIANSKDLFIFISQSGETEVLIDALETLQEKDCSTILITESEYSTIASLTNLSLVTPSKINVALAEMISNQLSLLLVTDIIFMYIFLSDPHKYKNIYEKTLIHRSLK